MRQPCSSLRATHSPRLTTFFLIDAVLELTHLAAIRCSTRHLISACLDTRLTAEMAIPVMFAFCNLLQFEIDCAKLYLTVTDSSQHSEK